MSQSRFGKFDRAPRRDGITTWHQQIIQIGAQPGGHCNNVFRDNSNKVVSKKNIYIAHYQKSLMRWTCDTSNITWRSKSSNDAWKCLKSALDLPDCLVMHFRLTDLPPKTPESQTSFDGTVERSVSVEQQIAGTDVQWPPTTTWGGLPGTVERSHVANGMPVLPSCSAP